MMWSTSSSLGASTTTFTSKAFRDAASLSVTPSSPTKILTELRGKSINPRAMALSSFVARIFLIDDGCSSVHDDQFLITTSPAMPTNLRRGGEFATSLNDNV